MARRGGPTSALLLAILVAAAAPVARAGPIMAPDRPVIIGAPPTLMAPIRPVAIGASPAIAPQLHSASLIHRLPAARAGPIMAPDRPVMIGAPSVLMTPDEPAAGGAPPALVEEPRQSSLIHRLRLFKGPQERVPITWHTYYARLHQSPFIQQILKATSIALGAKVRGYYTLTLGMRLRPEGGGVVRVVPEVHGW